MAVIRPLFDGFIVTSAGGATRALGEFVQNAGTTGGGSGTVELIVTDATHATTAEVIVISNDASDTALTVDSATSALSSDQATLSTAEVNDTSILVQDAVHTSGSSYAAVVRPNGVVDAGGYTPVGAATLYECLNEVIPNDSTYITGNTYPTVIALEDVADPGSNTGHTINFRAWSGSGWLAVALLQGNTTIREQVYSATFPAVPTTSSFTLTQTEADSITNYNDLRLQVRSVTGTVSFSWAEFRVDKNVDLVTSVTSAELIVANAASTVASDQASLTSLSSLDVADAVHASSSDQPTLSTAEVSDTAVLVQDAGHASSSESVLLTSAGYLVINVGTSSVVSDTVTISAAGMLSLIVSDGTHAHVAAVPALTSSQLLIIADAANSHMADGPAITTESVLQVVNAVHNQSTDNLTLSSGITLAILDALHLHTATVAKLSILVPMDPLTINRRYTVEPEDRNYIVAAEDRTYRVTSENRTFIVAKD